MCGKNLLPVLKAWCQGNVILKIKHLVLFKEIHCTHLYEHCTVLIQIEWTIALYQNLSLAHHQIKIPNPFKHSEFFIRFVPVVYAVELSVSHQSSDFVKPIFIP